MRDRDFCKGLGMGGVAFVSIALGVSSASAQSVYLVDDTPGPGVDYSTIQAAVDASGPLDRIDVNPGTYGHVVVDKQVKVMGVLDSNMTRVMSLTVVGLPAGEVAVFSKLEVNGVELASCEGTVLMDTVSVTSVDMDSCSDVRLQTVHTRGTLDWISPKVNIGSGSFVQFVDCLVNGTLGSQNPLGGRGGVGVALDGSGSTVLAVDSEFWGGIGEWVGFGNPGGVAGEGGDAVSLSGASMFHAMDSKIHGGSGGWNPHLSAYAARGHALTGCSGPSSVIKTRSNFLGGTPGCAAAIDYDDTYPSLTIAGGDIPGTISTFGVKADPGASMRFFLGRRAVLQPIPNVYSPLLQSSERAVSLGALHPSGVLDLSFNIPSLDRGTLIFGQASRVLVGGHTALSNSVTLIVR